MMPRARVTIAWLAGVLGAIFAAGFAAGSLLEAYDANRGFDREAALIADALGVTPGITIGDVRAGLGRWSVDLARRAGAHGQVFATAGPNPPHELMRTIAAAGVDNINVIVRTPGPQPRLPIGCCDAILARLVYHHLREREGIARDLFMNLRPGGRIAVIEFGEGSTPYQGGHGIALETVVGEFRSAGFIVARQIDEWPGRAYCVVFTRPEGATTETTRPETPP